MPTLTPTPGKTPPKPPGYAVPLPIPILKRSQISLFIPSEAARHAGRSPDVLVQEQTQDVLLKFLRAMLRPMLERIEQAPNDESIGHPLLRRKGIAKCVQDLSAQLLSVRIFSVLVNSMPDERTNSTITWLNSPVRGNQQSRSIINMIQVGQWYGKHVKDEPKASRSQARPAVKFRVIDKSVLEGIQTRSEEEYATEEGDGSDSDEEENSVTVPAESSRTTDDSLPLPLPVAFKVNPHIDLKSAALRDMISEEPIVQAHATVRISEMAPESDGATVTVEQAFAECVALYGLFVFYGLMLAELEGKRPMSKFAAIKLIVMFTFYQSFLFQTLASHNVLKGTDYWTPRNVARSERTCDLYRDGVFLRIHMASKEYQRKPVMSATRIWGPLWDSINFSDFGREIVESLKFYVDYCCGKPSTRSRLMEEG
ncbi:hypothetical protein JOM56_005273 [Amanita muscaria]